MHERELTPLLDEEITASMPGLARAEIQGLDSLAFAKFYILDDRYWSFYPTAYDRTDTLFGLMATPDGAELTYRSLSELERVNADLDLVIERDPDFEPKSLREVIDTFHDENRARDWPGAAF